MILCCTHLSYTMHFHLIKDRKPDSVESDLHNIRCMEVAKLSATWSHPNSLESGMKAIEMGTHKRSKS